MEEAPERHIDQSGRGPDSSSSAGAQMLDWLLSDEATAVARRALARCGFAGQPALVDDVLSDARLAILTRMRSSTPLDPRNPVAYATVVLRNVVNGLTRGDIMHLEDLDDHEAPGVPPVGGNSADELRLILEQRDAAPWLTAAALAYVCFLMEPDDIPDCAPAPRAGARPDQALAWPALWFAGERHLFPTDADEGSTDPCKRTRARRIKAVLDHMAEVFSLYRSEGGGSRG